MVQSVDRCEQILLVEIGKIGADQDHRSVWSAGSCSEDFVTEPCPQTPAALGSDGYSCQEESQRRRFRSAPLTETLASRTLSWRGLLPQPACD